MSRKIKTLIFIIFIFLFSFTLFSCMSSIANIKKNPEYFNGQKVHIFGFVKKVDSFFRNEDNFPEIPLFMYLLEDNFDEIAILSTSKVYVGQQKSVNGKVIIFKNGFYQSEIQFVITEIKDYLSKKNALPSSKKKASQKAFVSIISIIINILTQGKFEEPINSLSEIAQDTIDSALDEIDKEYIEEMTQALIKFLPKDEIYYLILED